MTQLDRLGRDALHLTETVTALARQGVEFRSLAEQLDTTSPAGRLVFGVFASLPRSNETAPPSAPARAAGRARGRVSGRPLVMTMDKLTAARAMLRDGATITAAARVIGVSRATLYRHLGEPVTAMVSDPDGPSEPVS